MAATKILIPRRRVNDFPLYADRSVRCLNGKGQHSPSPLRVTSAHPQFTGWRPRRIRLYRDDGTGALRPTGMFSFVCDGDRLPVFLIVSTVILSVFAKIVSKRFDTFRAGAPGRDCSFLLCWVLFPFDLFNRHASQCCDGVIRKIFEFFQLHRQQLVRIFFESLL